ncbi:hypothetical protein NL676_028939 [Syzygium grande]|nr:hypothetical protein NL676_028939 [Syzygium grande]
MDMDPCMPSSSQAPNNAPSPPQILPCGPSSLPDLDRNKGAPMTSHPNTGNNFEENTTLKRKLELLYRKEASIRNELEFAASLSLKKLRMEVANWLVIVDKLRNDCTEAASEDRLLLHQQADILMHEAEDRKRQGKGLFDVRETKVGKLLEEKMVGKAFQRNTKKILEHLVGNQMSQLGIYGMGGVGKTTIMVHVHNKLLEKPDYGHVLWITVSQDFNIQRLQDTLGMELGLGILQEKDVRKRAAMLCDCLTKRGKSTIILDDVWERFDLKEVGIPVRADGIKLVLTTRSFEVCRQMHCQEMIKIEPLSHIEAESLFLEKLGSEVALNLETKSVVKSIVEECAGLPLAVITMARSMQGVTDVFEWKDSLEKLKESDLGQTDMEKEVLMKLEFSYNRLRNHEVQQCFLSCALYPEDERIDKHKETTRRNIGGLRNLQYLKVQAINGEDITKLWKLWKLETLECSFEDVDDFNKFARVVSKQRNNPCYYDLHVGEEASIINVEVSHDIRFGNSNRIARIDTWSRAIVSAGGESSDICILIPLDVQTLIASNCNGTTNLSDMGPLENLETLEIEQWKNLRVLYGGQDEEIIDIHDPPAPTPASLLFPSLRVLEISGCPKLKYLFGHGPKFILPHLRKIAIKDCEEMVGITVAVTSPPLHPSPAFPSLEKISVRWCHKMKRVVESEWLPHLPNLKDIRVFYCENMEEIIGDIQVYHCKGMVEMISGAGQGQEESITTPINNAPSSFQSSISLPKLKRLWLRDLPQLKSICEVPITCDSMENLMVSECPELNRIPLQLRDHANLQSRLRFHGNTCVLNGGAIHDCSPSGSESSDDAFEEE